MAMNTTPTSAEAWAPNVVSTFAADDLLKEALIVQVATKAGTVLGDEPSLLVPYIRVDPTAEFVDEGDEIPFSEGEFDQISIQTRKVAVLSRVSRELIEQPGAATRIAESVKRAVVAKADAAFLNGVDPVGLLDTPGLPNAGSIGTGGIAPVYAAVGAIEQDGGQASHILMSPLDWALLAGIPTGTGSNQSMLADVHSAAERSLGGVPVIVHAAVPQGTAIVLDRSEVVAAVGDLKLARSDEAAFAFDASLIRCTFRFGFGIVRPARVQLLTVAGA